MALLTVEEVARHQKRWMALSEKWLDDLWLANWAITYHWMVEPLDKRAPEERRGPTDSICETKDGIPAHVYVQWHYMASDVEVDLRIIALLDDRELERLFLHEMMHIILGGMALMRKHEPSYKQMEEYVATWLAKSLIWVRMHVAPVPEEREYTTDGPKGSLVLDPTTVGPVRGVIDGQGDVGGPGGAGGRGQQPDGDGHDESGAGDARPHDPGVSDLPRERPAAVVPARARLPVAELRATVRHLSELRLPDQVDAPAR